MKDINAFFLTLGENRRSAQAAACAGFIAPPDLQPPPALEAAIRHNLPIAPLLARSAYAPRSARVGLPSSAREQIEYWLAAYPKANWTLQTGAASGVAALEIEPDLATYSLDYLAGEDCSWRRTLHFTTGPRWFYLFGHVASIQRLPGCYEGLRLHSVDAILAPPSLTLAGEELRYADPRAPLLAAPDWLCGEPELPF